jgi:hypothetical protein
MCDRCSTLPPPTRQCVLIGAIKIFLSYTTTIILSISRLVKVFVSLELLECDREWTSLLAFVDGEADLFLTGRDLVEQSKVAGSSAG